MEKEKIDNEILKLIESMSHYFNNQENLIKSYGKSGESSISKEVDNLVMSLDRDVFIELVIRVMLLSMKVTKTYNTTGIMFENGLSYEQMLDEAKKREDMLYSVENLFVNDKVGIVVSNFLLNKIGERLNKLNEFDVNKDWIRVDSYFDVFNKIVNDIENNNDEKDMILSLKCFIIDVKNMDFGHKVLSSVGLASDIKENIHKIYRTILEDSLIPSKSIIKNYLVKVIAQEESLNSISFIKEYQILDFLVEEKLKSSPLKESMLLESYSGEIAEYMQNKRFELIRVFVKNIAEKYEFWEKCSGKNEYFKKVHTVFKDMLSKVENFESIENSFIKKKNNENNNTVTIKVSLLKIGVANNINIVSGPMTQKELTGLRYSEHIYSKNVHDYIERNSLDRFGENYLEMIVRAIKDIDGSWKVVIDRYPTGSSEGLKIIELTLSSENNDNVELLLTLMGKAIGIVGVENGYENGLSPVIEEYLMKNDLSQSAGNLTQKKAGLKKF